MKKIVAALLVVALLVVGVFALVSCNDDQTDAEYILEKGTLVCGITLYEPMSYFNSDGDLIGFDTEFTEKVCAELGLEAKFQVIKWGSKEVELSSKSIDCIWNGLTVTEDRKENMDFTSIYLQNKQVVVVKASEVANYTSADACQGKKASAEIGSAGETAALSLTTEAKYTGQQAQSTALTELNSGNVDFIVIDYTMATAMVGKGDYANLAIAENIVLESEDYAIGFRKGSDMVDKVNPIIAKFQQDGTLATLAEKYGLTNLLVVA